jgi:hypothetical protein
MSPLLNSAFARALWVIAILCSFLVYLHIFTRKISSLKLKISGKGAHPLTVCPQQELHYFLPRLKLLLKTTTSGKFLALPCSKSMTISSLSGLGFGCEANSRSFAESLSVRALSTGPKTLLFRFWWFVFVVLALDPFAILSNLIIELST